MAESVCHAVEFRRLNDRHFGADFMQYRHEIVVWIVFTVKQHIEQGEFNLSQSLQTTLEVFRGHHFVEQSFWQGLASFDMRRHVLDNRPLPAKVFHELTGQFHGIPFNATDARDIPFIHLRQHVMQAMAKFVEQGDHIVVGKQSGIAIDALCKIADQMRNRGLELTIVGAQPT